MMWIKTYESNNININKDTLISIGNKISTDNFLNCKSFIQLVTGVDEILNLMKTNKLEIGNILVWGRESENDTPRHYSIYIGDNELMEVEEWGAPMRIIDYDVVYKEYDGHVEMFETKKELINMKQVKNIHTTFENFLTENLEPTHQERFNRAIYLHYVGINAENKFKRVSRDEFHELLINKFQKKKSIDFDKNLTSRLADEKIVWLGDYNDVMGEVWKEGDIESYWINSLRRQ